MTSINGKGLRNLVTHIYVDADACSVKNEVYRVAQRHGLSVTLVANSYMRTPQESWVELVLVKDNPDAADDLIVERVTPGDIVVTTDIPLVARCIAKGARVLGPKGRVFTEASIGDALANRDLSAHLREHGMTTNGPAPFTQQDRSRFLQRLEEAVQASLRG
jgi:uncharacterized protein YaiI (UPF0178 family)